MNEIIHAISQYQSILSAWRHHLHRHPELSWDEVATTAYIIEQLHTMGVTDIQRPLDTGLIATISSIEPDTNCIALRADIDALPIAELNTCEYRSIHEGVMHACGHDVHTTCLLGATKFLMDHKHLWRGTIKLLFQPSEEKQPSGAAAMIAAGALTHPTVSSIIGLHVTPELEVGKLGFKSGQFMASADEIYLKVIGKGGHGASPHLCIDPIVISAQIILALQQVVSRYADPKVPTVLTFGDIHGAGATNIIPDYVDIKGTFRTFDEKWRKEAHQLIRSIATNIATGYGAICEVTIPEGIPYVFNDPILTDSMSHWAAKLVGKENVIDMPLRMGAEDFSYYGHEVTASFFRLGTGNVSQNITASVHTPHFDIDERALAIGSAAMAFFAIQQLQ